MEWNIISEKGLPKDDGRYGVIYRYKEEGKQVYIHTSCYVVDFNRWVNLSGKIEILAWCEFPPIPSQFII